MELLILGFILSVLAPFVTEWLRRIAERWKGELFERWKDKATSYAAARAVASPGLPGSPAELLSLSRDFIYRTRLRGLVGRAFANLLAARLNYKHAETQWNTWHAEGKVSQPSAAFTAVWEKQPDHAKLERELAAMVAAEQ